MTRLNVSILILLLATFLPAKGQQYWLPEGDYRVYEKARGGSHLGVENTLKGQSATKTYYSNYTHLTKKQGAFLVDTTVVMMDHHLWDTVTWCGNISYDSNTDTIYMFRYGYPFRCHPQLNEQWKLKNLPNGQYLRATVVSIAYDASAPVPDSIVTIELNSFNASDNPVTTPYDGTQVKIGKTIGLYSFPLFLTDSTSTAIDEMKLVYSENLGVGDIRTDVFKVFEFEAGDEIHTIKDSWSYGSETREYRVRKIIDVQQGATFIIVTDSFSSGGYTTITLGPESGKVTKLIPSVTLRSDTVFLPDFTFVSNRQLEAGMDSSAASNFYTTYEPPTEKERVPGRKLITQSDKFLKDVSISPLVAPAYRSTCTATIEQCSTHTYFEGLGGPYVLYQSLGGGYHEYPVYYKKTGSTWGTPITKSQLMTVSSALTNDNQVYPNPANTDINFVWAEAGQTRIKVLNMEGKTIYEGELTNGNNKINTSGYAVGLYTYVISSPESMTTGKFAVIH